MKIEELRLLIKEVVQETMREELSNILTEAVKIASTPDSTIVSSAGPRTTPKFTTPEWVKELAVPGTVTETYHPKPSSSPTMKKDPMSILAATAESMTREDLNNFM